MLKSQIVLYLTNKSKIDGSLVSVNKRTGERESCCFVHPVHYFKVSIMKNATKDTGWSAPLNARGCLVLGLLKFFLVQVLN